jgi:hypothetical protein
LRRRCAAACGGQHSFVAVLAQRWAGRKSVGWPSGGGSIHIEKVHPLEAGLFRYKFRRDRRPGFAIRAALNVLSAVRLRIDRQIREMVGIYAGQRLIYMRAKRDPAGKLSLHRLGFFHRVPFRQIMHHAFFGRSRAAQYSRCYAGCSGLP